ncbi:MAG: hypothetical protein ACK4UN_19165, partial [Limisphaerales bacterium]
PATARPRTSPTSGSATRFCGSSPMGALEEIKARVNIVDLLGRYIALKPAGNFADTRLKCPCRRLLHRYSGSTIHLFRT